MMILFKKKYIIYLIIVPISLIIMYYNYQGGIKEREIYTMVTVSWEIHSKIIKKEHSSYFNNRGVNFTTSKNEKFFFPVLWNYDYEEPNLIRFVQIGDSINKQKDSDTIYIYRNNQEFYFVIGKVINLPAK